MLKLNPCKVFILILVQVVLAFMALSGFGFFFRSGTAGAGILILGIVFYRELKQSKDIWMIIAAFLFSIGGDWFLSNKNGDTEMFIAGIALFFVAHIGYLSYALMNGKMNWPFLGILLAGYLLFFFLKLSPSLDSAAMTVAVLAYLLISCFSLGAAVGIKASAVERWSFIFGVVMILFSDTIISFREFLGYKEMDFLVLPTYYIAHISVTFSLLKRAGYKAGESKS